MAVDDRLKALTGTSRRNFLRWSAAASVALGLDRANYLNVLGDTAGTALADTAAASKTAKSVHLIAANGGLAWFTQLFPYPGVAKSGSTNAALYAAGNAYKDAVTDKPSVYAPDSPFQKLGKGKQMTVFIAGNNETHTRTPSSALTLGTNGLLAAVSAIQAATPSLLPVMAINPVNFGSAPGAAAPATVANAAGLVDLFNSAASKTLLQDPKDATLAEAYFSAFSQLNAAAGQKTLNKTYGTARTAQALLAKNLADQLKMTTEDLTRYGITGSTPTNIAEIGTAMGTAVKAFALGLTSSLIVPAMNDDPHGAFQNKNTLTTNVQTLGKIFDAFVADALAAADPSGGSGKLGDDIVITISGDTPKDARTASGWPDGTAQNHNLLMVYGSGWLKSGWFGGMDAQGKVTTWDPATGNAGTQTSGQLASSAAAAVAYAVAKGDDRRVQDFGVAPPKGVTVLKSV
ncbi:MAG: hypothetical protein U0270_34260 [Labilithrix sp.]